MSSKNKSRQRETKQQLGQIQQLQNATWIVIVTEFVRKLVAHLFEKLPQPWDWF